MLPADGRGSATWEVDELDKVGYRGVGSAAYRFHAHQAPGAQVLGDAPARARDLSTAAKLLASDTAVWAVDVASRLAASRPTRPATSSPDCAATRRRRRSARGANDALLMALARPLLR